MPDQNDTSALVVILQIIPPGGEHVAINESAVHRNGLTAHDAAQASQGDLPIHWSIGPAYRCEARELLLDRTPFASAWNQAAIAVRVIGNRRVDVEAVDRGCRIRFPALARHAAIPGDDRAAQVAGANVLSAGPAQPCIGRAVDIFLRLVSRGGARDTAQRQGSDEPRGKSLAQYRHELSL